MGLKHCEVSAKYGTGVDDMMQEMVLQALEPQEQIITDREHQDIIGKSTIMDGTTGGDTTRQSSSQVHYDYRPNQELDLHKRYVPKEQSCWIAFRPFHWCCKP